MDSWITSAEYFRGKEWWNTMCWRSTHTDDIEFQVCFKWHINLSILGNLDPFLTFHQIFGDNFTWFENWLLTLPQSLTFFTIVFCFLLDLTWRIYVNFEQLITRRLFFNVVFSNSVSFSLSTLQHQYQGVQLKRNELRKALNTCISMTLVHSL